MLTIPAWLVTTLSRLALLRVVCAKYGRHSQVLWLLCAKSGPKSREATLSVIAVTAFVYGLNIHVDRQSARLRKYATLLLLSQDTTFVIISREGNKYSVLYSDAAFATLKHSSYKLFFSGREMIDRSTGMPGKGQLPVVWPNAPNAVILGIRNHQASPTS